jgi:hypothetical protein
MNASDVQGQRVNVFSQPNGGTQIVDAHTEFHIGGSGGDRGNFTDLTAVLKIDASASVSLPPGAHRLAAKLKDEHLLVLQPCELDTKTVCQQVASQLFWLLSEEGGDKIVIERWDHHGGLLDLDTALAGEVCKILLVPDVALKNIVLKLGTVARKLRELRGQYAIITTEQDEKRWATDASETRLWERPDWVSYYTKEYLQTRLIHELNLLLHRVQDTPVADLLRGVSVEEVVEELKDPDRLCNFAKGIADARPDTKDLVWKMIEEKSGDPWKAGLWLSELDPRDQLLALGLLLFEGLPADQVFAALETLVDEVWRPAQPLFAHFDYIDVERLRRYVKPPSLQEMGGPIVVTAQGHIFEAGWELHQRRILASLPAIAEMLRRAGQFLEILEVDPTKVKPVQPPDKAAATPKAGAADQDKAAPAPRADAADREVLWRMSRSRELYGTVRRMAGLQDAAFKTLKRIGQVSAEGFQSVQPCLRELAGDGSDLVRKAVARALADSRHWTKTEDAAPRLFALLVAWWAEACRVGDTLSPETRAEMDAIRATIALTVGYAAQDDWPAPMAEPLVRLLDGIVKDRNPPVRRAAMEILPWVITLYLHQLEELVCGPVAGQADLLEVAAVGVAVAYSLRPRETSQILDGWRERAASAGKGEQEILLSLVASTLGHLRAKADDPIFPPARIFAELSSILSTSRAWRVRRHVLAAAGNQAIRNYQLAAPLLTQVLAEVSLEERDLLIRIFLRAYVDQRAQLAGGDDKIQVGDQLYPVWTSGHRRPHTEMEEALYHWLQEWDLPVAQQVAAESFAVLTASALDCKEREFLAGVAAPPQQAAQAVPTLPIQPVLVRILGPLAWLALAAIARGRELRAALAAPLAELIWIGRQPPVAAAAGASGSGASPARQGLPAPGSALALPLAPVQDVLARWRSAATGESMQEFINYLERALGLYRARWPILLVSCVLILLVIEIVKLH